MGLDMYAYVGRPGQRDEFYEKAEWDSDSNELIGPVSKPREIAYWRKHPNLHGWMQNLWLHKLDIPKNSSDQFIENKIPKSFNGIELELTWDDVDKLEKDIKAGVVKNLGTTGFFFGDPSDDYYREHDLKFCIDAKAELFLGLKVFYNSSW